jgi:hypothetical protein
MAEKENYLIEECRFCGNKTKLDIVGSHSIDEEYEYYDDNIGAEAREWISNTTWFLLKCCVCDNISLGNCYVDDSLGSRGLDFISIVYPMKTYDSFHLPKEIYNAYEVALKARYLDGALCLLSLRRTLEIICKQQGEIKGDLVVKIQNLASKGILPTVLKDASDILRKLGNEAAHGDDKQFDRAQVDQMINFTEAIIDYIYILPNKISKIKGSIK